MDPLELLDPDPNGKIALQLKKHIVTFVKMPF
jgi:hypothetical protein